MEQAAIFHLRRASWGPVQSLFEVFFFRLVIAIGGENDARNEWSARLQRTPLDRSVESATLGGCHQARQESVSAVVPRRRRINGEGAGNRS